VQAPLQVLSSSAVALRDVASRLEFPERPFATQILVRTTESPFQIQRQSVQRLQMQQRRPKLVVSPGFSWR
jgi:hypothetical protein